MPSDIALRRTFRPCFSGALWPLAHSPGQLPDHIRKDANVAPADDK
jgi:hypothetical protein